MVTSHAWRERCATVNVRSPQRRAAARRRIPYQGEPLENEDEIYRGQPKSGTSHFHAYASVYVVRKGQRFTLAATYVRKGEKLEDILKRLLRRAAQTGVKPR